MTIDELLATSPTPWTSLQGIAFDCNGIIVPTSWGIVPNDMNALLVEAVNRIGELQAERDESMVAIKNYFECLCRKVDECKALTAERDRGEVSPIQIRLLWLKPYGGRQLHCIDDNARQYYGDHVVPALCGLVPKGFFTGCHHVCGSRWEIGFESDPRCSKCEAAFRKVSHA